MSQGDPDWQETNPEWFNTWTVSRSFQVWGAWTPTPHHPTVAGFTVATPSCFWCSQFCKVTLELVCQEEEPQAFLCIQNSAKLDMGRDRENVSSTGDIKEKVGVCSKCVVRNGKKEVGSNE